MFRPKVLVKLMAITSPGTMVFVVATSGIVALKNSPPNSRSRKIASIAAGEPLAGTDVVINTHRLLARVLNSRCDDRKAIGRARVRRGDVRQGIQTEQRLRHRIYLPGGIVLPVNWSPVPDRRLAGCPPLKSSLALEHAGNGDGRSQARRFDDGRNSCENRKNVFSSSYCKGRG